MSGMLRQAAAGKGNFGIGAATRKEAETMGKAWVGEGYRVASDGKTLISRDGMRQYRPPTLKGNGKTQANFERKADASQKQWHSNAHLDIVD
jgi:filamentous hemagglutinin